MDKDFDTWNTQKKRVDGRTQVIRYHEREVWWCWLGVNVGYEQDGIGAEYRRPVVIITGLGSQTCLVVPLTTSVRVHKLRPPIGAIAGKEARALISQLRVIDVRRLSQKIQYLKKARFVELKRLVREMI